MSDTGTVTAQVGAFQVTTNSGVSEADLRSTLKPKADKAASEAASQLGKRGAEARAEKREAEEPQPEPEKKPIRPIPPKVEAKAEPEEKPEPEPKEEKAEEPEPEKPEEKPEEKKPNPRHDPKARMLEATRKEAEAKRALAEERQRRAELEERLSRLERGERSAEPPKAAPRVDQSTTGNGKPQPQDYETYEEYLDARDSFNRSQWEGEITKRAQADAMTRALDQAAHRFRDSAAKVVDQISDEVGLLRTEFQLAPGEQATGENWVANELVFSPESAPALMLHFTAHPEDLQRIAALPTPRAVSREMAKLEARLDAATSGPSTRREEQVSRAAPPVKPVTGSPYVTESDEYRPGMTLDEYQKVWKRTHKR